MWTYAKPAPGPLGGALRMALAVAGLVGLMAVFGSEVKSHTIQVAGADLVLKEPARLLPPAGRTGSPHYQLRCWQYGRLILEENGLSAPAESGGYALRLGRVERKGTLYLVQTSNATCALRPGDGEPVPPGAGPGG